MQEFVLRFNNPRVAKYFAEKHGYEYLGYVEGKTSIRIARATGDVQANLNGCYMVREFRKVEDES